MAAGSETVSGGPGRVRQLLRLILPSLGPLIGVLALQLIHPTVLFSGDASAAGAQIYVDGARVGQLPGAADSIVAGGSVYRSAFRMIEHQFPRGRHSVVFVSRLGDSLSGEFRTRDASSVSVSFFTKKIQGVEPLRR
jgi:hypothetical protein